MAKIEFKNKKIKKRKNKTGPNEWLVMLVVFFFIVIGVQIYEFVDRGFPLRSIGIKCNKIDPEDVQNIIAINPGTNLFKINLKKIVLNLKKDPRIKQVYVLKNLCEGKIEVTINERMPYVKILKPGTDKCFEIDSEGIFIGEANNVLSDAPLLTGAMKGTGDTLALFKQENKTIKKAIEILKTCELSGIQLNEISEINVKDPQDLVIFSVSGTEFHVEQDDLKNQLKKAAVIFNEIKTKKINVRYVDLRFGDEAVTRM